VNGSELEKEVTEAQQAWLEVERERRRLSDRRIRAVWHAVDGGCSHGQVAKAMSSCGRLVRQGDVSHILACGYPEPEEGEVA
jgi:hypothetical protein